jgi:hypothetical protein
MNRKTLFILLVAALAGTPSPHNAPVRQRATGSSRAVPHAGGGLRAPNADLSAYRKVIVDPGQAALKKNWLKDINAARRIALALPSDARRSRTKPRRVSDLSSP